MHSRHIDRAAPGLQGLGRLLGLLSLRRLWRLPGLLNLLSLLSLQRLPGLRSLRSLLSLRSLPGLLNLRSLRRLRSLPGLLTLRSLLGLPGLLTLRSLSLPGLLSLRSLWLQHGSALAMRGALASCGPASIMAVAIRLGPRHLWLQAMHRHVGNAAGIVNALPTASLGRLSLAHGPWLEGTEADGIHVGRSLPLFSFEMACGVMGGGVAIGR